MTGLRDFKLRTRSMNSRIYETLRDNPGEWMTAAEINAPLREYVGVDFVKEKFEKHYGMIGMVTLKNPENN